MKHWERIPERIEESAVMRAAPAPFEYADVAPAPAVSYAAPAPGIEYAAEPAVTYTALVPVNENVAPVPAVSHAAPAPASQYAADHAVTCTAPALVNENVAPAPAVSHAAPASVIEYAADDAVTHTAPAPVNKNVTPAPVRQDCQGICGLQHSHESSELLQIEPRDKGEKSHAVQTAAESRPRCDYDVQEGVECGGNESDLALPEGQSDQGHCRFRAVVQATGAAIAPAVTHGSRAPVIELTAPVIAGTDTEPVPVSQHGTPAPAVTYGRRAPVIESMEPVPAVTDTALVPVSEHVAPAPAVTYGSRAPVIGPMAAGPAVTYTAPAPVNENVAASEMETAIQEVADLLANDLGEGDPEFDAAWARLIELGRERASGLGCGIRRKTPGTVPKTGT